MAMFQLGNHTVTLICTLFQTVRGRMDLSRAPLIAVIIVIEIILDLVVLLALFLE